MALFGKVSQPVGLDIGSDVIRVAQIKPAADPVLLKYEKEITHGCLTDGECTDVDALASHITNLWKKANIAERQVILGVSNQKVIVRLLTLPFMEKDDLDGAIQFQAQDNIPIPIEDAILDYQVINEFTNKDNERSMQVILVAAQKEMVQNYVAALEKAKLKPYIVDVSSFVLSRSLLPKEAIVPNDKEIVENAKATGFLDIGESVTNICVVQNRTPLFCRTTTIGDNTFTKAIADSMGVSLEVGFNLKSEIGFSKPGDDLGVGLKAKQAENGLKVRTILAEEAGRFVNEVRRSFEYGLSETGDSDELSELIVTGAGTQNKNLLAYLKDVYSKVTIGDPLSSVKLPGDSKLDDLGYAIAIGLALRGQDA